MKKLLSILSLLFILGAFTIGCGPSYVTVRTRPQPPVYARPVTPGANYVWVEGEWVRSRHGYIYRRGYWAAPRPRFHQYVPGHWQHRRHGWVWIPGHWN